MNTPVIPITLTDEDDNSFYVNGALITSAHRADSITNVWMSEGANLLVCKERPHEITEKIRAHLRRHSS